MLATTQWPLECAAHLTSLVWVCVLWLPESLMDLSALCCQLDPKEQTSVTFQSKFNHFHSRKCIWKCHLRNWGHFVQWEWDELRFISLVLEQCVPVEQPWGIWVHESREVENDYMTTPEHNKTMCISCGMQPFWHVLPLCSIENYYDATVGL